MCAVLIDQRVIAAAVRACFQTLVHAAAMLMVVIMLPFIFFALYEKDGQPAEKYLYHIVQSMFIRDKVRPYRTKNLYAEIQQKIKEQEELQLEQQHSKGKA